jgi:hypothetical protein
VDSIRLTSVAAFLRGLDTFPNPRALETYERSADFETGATEILHR